MITQVLAQATVTDLERAQDFYDRLFDRSPDANPMPGLIEYHLGEGSESRSGSNPSGPVNRPWC